jgi:penicillin amidase
MPVRARRVVSSLLLLVVALVGVAAFWAHRELTGTLPDLDGDVILEGLSSPVTVDRDTSGVPTIRAETRHDLARALGFLHAQERFFQMDLMRRRAAGELAEILGPSVLDVDRYHRVHRMRSRAERVLERASADELALLSAYVEGVNAGLGALGAPPFEYLALRSEPAPWRPSDSILVVFSMFFELNDDHGTLESADALLRDVLSPELAAFLSPAGTEWDAPLFGDALSPAPIPGPGTVQLEAPSTAHLDPEDDIRGAEIGSNNWALAGAKTRHGGAILASDMHLGHAVPNLWYRALLIYGSRRLIGVTLPGTPSLVAGSNGDIAWGFTNTGGDWVDLVAAEPPFATYRETITVKGEAPVALEVRETEAGPVIDEDHDGHERSLRWIAHDPRGVNMRLALLEETTSVSAALAIAPTIGIPPQNFVVADREGSIGWTVAGRIPRRTEDGRWDGFLEADEYTVLMNPPTGAIWTANARVADGEMLRKMGDGDYTLGARAKQIRDAPCAT